MRFDGFDKLVRFAGDAAEMAQEIEGDALGRQDGAGFAFDFGKVVSGLHDIAVFFQQRKNNIAVERPKGQPCQTQSRDNACLTRIDCPMAF